MPAGDVATLQHRFADFAASHPELTLYSSVCRQVADDPETAALLADAGPGQDRPVCGWPPCTTWSCATPEFRPLGGTRASSAGTRSRTATPGRTYAARFGTMRPS